MLSIPDMLGTVRRLLLLKVKCNFCAVTVFFSHLTDVWNLERPHKKARMMLMNSAYAS